MTQTRTIVRNETILYGQFAGIVMVAVFSYIMVINPRPDQPVWAWLGFSVVFLLVTLCIPRIRVDVTDGVISVREIQWWKTVIHRFAADQPPPAITMTEHPSKGTPYYTLNLLLPTGRKIEIAQNRNRVLVLDEKLSLMRLWDQN